MPYVEDITEPLIKTLTYAGGLPVRQLAGHAANLEFWVREVEHAFAVIDGYGERFKKLQEGERIAAERLGIEWHPFHERKLVRPGIGGLELKELRYRLLDTVSQFLRRCYNEGLVTEAALDNYCKRLDLDSFELKRTKKS
jgi:hypothetical protein